MFSNVMSTQPDSAYPVDVENEKLIKISVPLTLMVSKCFHTDLAISSASFPFVMCSRIFLLFVVKIWRSHSSKHSRVDGL